MSAPVIVTSRYGPNLMPVGTHGGRPVQMSYALGGGIGSWYYTDVPPSDPRAGYVPAGTPVDWSRVYARDDRDAVRRGDFGAAAELAEEEDRS